MNIRDIIDKVISECNMSNDHIFAFPRNRSEKSISELIFFARWLLSKERNLMITMADVVYSAFNLANCLAICNSMKMQMDYNNVENYEVGQKLKLGNAIVRFAGIQRMYGKDKFVVEAKNGSTYIDLAKVPTFQMTTTSKGLSLDEKFEEERKRYERERDNHLINELKNRKSYSTETVCIVGVSNRYTELYKNVCMDGIKLSELFIIENYNKNGDKKRISVGQFKGTPHIVYCSSLYTVAEAVEDGLEVSRIIVDGNSGYNFENEIDVIEELMDESIPICIVSSPYTQGEVGLLNELGVRHVDLTDSQLIEAFNLRPDNRLDILSRYLYERNVVVEMAPFSNIAEWYALFNKIDGELEELPDDLLREIFRLKRIFYDLLHRVIPFEKDEASEIIYNINSIKNAIEPRENIIEFDMVQNIHQLISSMVLYFRESAPLSKNEKLDKLLSSYRGKKVVVVVSKKSDINSTVKYWSDRFSTQYTVGTVDFMTITNYNRRKIRDYNAVIFTGWFGSSEMKKAIYSTQCKSVYILLNELEVKWRNGHVRQWELAGQKNDNAELLSELDIKYMTKPSVQPVSGIIDLQELNVFEKKMFDTITSSYNSSSSKERLSAIPIVFDDGTFVFGTDNHKFINVTDVVNGESEVARKSSSQELKVGDHVAIRSSEKSMVRDLADVILEQNGQNDQRNKVERWRKPFVDYVNMHGIAESHRILKNMGCKRDLVAVRNWALNEDFISPQKIDDLYIVNKLIGFADSDEEVVDTFESCKIVKQAHKVAGRQLTKRLSKAIAKDLYTENENSKEMHPEGAFFVEGVGLVKILQVDGISDKREVDRLHVNRILN